MCHHKALTWVMFTAGERRRRAQGWAAPLRGSRRHSGCRSAVRESHRSSGARAVRPVRDLPVGNTSLCNQRTRVSVGPLLRCLCLDVLLVLPFQSNGILWMLAELVIAWVFTCNSFHCNDLNDCIFSLSTETPECCWGNLCSNRNFVYLLLNVILIISICKCNLRDCILNMYLPKFRWCCCSTC